MTAPVFTWQADGQATGEVTLRVLASQFGDGYQQVAKDGINNKVQNWPLVFTGTADRIREIAAFLDARGGAEAFTWTPPLATVPGLYRAAKYSPQHLGGDTYRLSVTFMETFAP